MTKKFIVDIVGDQLEVAHYYLNEEYSKKIAEVLKGKEGEWELDYDYDIRDAIGKELITFPSTLKMHPVIQVTPEGSPDVLMRFFDKDLDRAAAHLISFDKLPKCYHPYDFHFPEQRNQLTVVQRSISDSDYNHFISRKEFELDEENMPTINDIELETELHHYGDDMYVIVKDFYIAGDEGEPVNHQGWSAMGPSKDISSKFYISSTGI